MHLLFHIHRLKSNLPKHAFAFKLAPFEGLIVTPPRQIPLKRKRSPTSLISTKIQISRHVITSVIIKMTDEVLLLCESRQDIYITEVLQTLQKHFSKTFEGLITEATLFAKQANLCQHFPHHRHQRSLWTNANVLRILCLGDIFRRWKLKAFTVFSKSPLYWLHVRGTTGLNQKKTQGEGSKKHETKQKIIRICWTVRSRASGPLTVDLSQQQFTKQIICLIEKNQEKNKSNLPVVIKAYGTSLQQK